MEIEPPPSAAPKAPSFETVAVLDARGISLDERDRVGKAQELLRSLPPDTPADVKRPIVEAALKAFGVSVNDIASAARHQIEALNGYLRDGESQMEQLEAAANQRIAELERHIAIIRQEVEKAREQQDQLAKQAKGVIDEVDPVLRFFSHGPPGPPPRRAPAREAAEAAQESEAPPRAVVVEPAAPADPAVS
jgi:hypothetical protein